MPTRRYTAEQLLFLRDSPLVKKPENLPAIEQWIDEAQQQRQGQAEQPGRINTRQANVATGGAASPMGNFSTGQRPSLLHTRTTGSRSDDVTLGPPKPGFAAGRGLTRMTSYHDGTPSHDHSNSEDIDFTKLRNDRQRKTTDKDLRGERETWTATRDRRALEGEHTRSDSNADRDIRPPKRDDASRRNGDRSDARWGAKDANGERQSGWRDRENNRRQWDRNEAAEREPEWFDEPVTAKQQQIDDEFSSAARTQEDFEKWKAKMHGKDLPDRKETAPAPPETVKPREALKLDGYVEPQSLFSIRSPEPTGDQGLPKPGGNKAKASRFASMFKKEDIPVETPPVPELPASPSAGLPLSNTADMEGFQRIMQMLGKNDTPSPTAVPEPRSPTKTTANGARQRSRFFDAAPKSPEETRPPMPQNDSSQQELTIRSQQPTGTSPLPPHMTPNHQRNSTIDTQGDVSRQGLPKSGTSTPENNVLNLIAGRGTARQSASNSKDTAFLLGLLQGHSSRPPSQSARPETEFPLWVSPLPEQHAPKPRAPPPPGHIDDHLLRGAAAGNDGEARRQPQRPPPGFDEQALFIQQQQLQYQRPPGQPQFDSTRRLDALPPGMPQIFGPAQSNPPFIPGPPPGFAHNIRHTQAFPPGMPGTYMGQPGPNGQRQAPGFPPGMPPGPPPGFGRGQPPMSGPPPGLMMPGAPNHGAGRQGFDNMYDQRR